MNEAAAAAACVAVLPTLALGAQKGVLQVQEPSGQLGQHLNRIPRVFSVAAFVSDSLGTFFVGID